MAPSLGAGDVYGLCMVPTLHTDTYPFIDPEQGAPAPLKVLVTGASKGIGRETVKSFARAGAAAIALLARSNLDHVEQEVYQAARQAGRKVPQVLKLRADMSDAAGVEQALAAVEQAFGALDVLVNNASRLEQWHPLAETNVDDWWATWEVNVKGTYIVTRAALPLLLRGELKTIATVSSVAALVTDRGASAYQSTKTAQIRLNDFLMAEYGDRGLNAFAIHPGGVQTELSLNMPEPMQVYSTQTAQLSADTIVWLTRRKREWLGGRFVFGPLDMQEFELKRDEIVAKDLLKLKLKVA